MELSSYEKATRDILGYLRSDPEILVLDWVAFNYLIYLAYGIDSGSRTTTVRQDQTYVSILDVIPTIFAEIEETLPHGIVESEHFVTHLVGYYGEVWISVVGPLYQFTKATSFVDDINMVEWQRHVRAKVSNDKTELTVLSVDPSKIVRDSALRRLKTL